MLRPKTPIELVVFDVAGTTVMDGDFVIDAMDEALRTADVHVERDAIRARMGLPKPVAIRTLLRDHSERKWDADHLIDDVHSHFLSRLIDGYRERHDIQEAAGASDVFAALHERGVKVALDTGFSRAVLDVLLERLRWQASGLIDCSVTSDEVSHGRPAPDLIRRAMQLTAVADSAAVMKVGDTPADLESGFAAACGQVVGVSYGTHSKRELQRLYAVPVLSRLADLLPLLAGEDAAEKLL